MALIDENPRKKLYTSLTTHQDPNVSEYFKNYSFEDFEKKLTTDKRAQEALFKELKGLNMAKDRNEFIKTYVAPPVVPSAAPEPPAKPVAVEKPKPVSQPEQPKEKSIWQRTKEFFSPDLFGRWASWGDTKDQQKDQMAQTLEKEFVPTSATKAKKDLDEYERVMSFQLKLQKEVTDLEDKKKDIGQVPETTRAQILKNLNQQISEKQAIINRGKTSTDAVTFRAKGRIDELMTTMVDKELPQDAYVLSKNGKRIPNERWVQDQTREITRKYGLPQDKYTYSLLKSGLSAALLTKERLPEIKTRANKIFAQEHGGKSMEQVLGEDNAKGIGELEAINKKYKTENVVFNMQLKAEYNEKEKELITGYKEKSNEIDQKIVNDAEIQAFVADYDARSMAPLQNLVNQGRISPEEANKMLRSEKAMEARQKAIIEQVEKKYGNELGVIYDRYLTGVSEIRSKMKARQDRQLAEKDKIYSAAFNQKKKEIISRSGKFSQKTLEEIKKAYNRAGKEIDAEEKTKLAQSDINAASYAQLMNGLIKGLGQGLEATAFAVGARNLSDFGAIVASEHETSDLSLDGWDSYKMNKEGLTRAINSIGITGGRMLPGIVSTAAIAAATRGRGLPLLSRMLMSTVPQAAFETADIVGSAQQEVLAKYGDVAKAMKAGERALEGQILLTPTYFIGVMPYFGEVTRKLMPIGRLGKYASAPARIALAGAAETAEEAFFQELPQNIFNEAIVNDKDPTLSVLVKNYTMDNVSKTLSQVLPITMAFGGAPQVYKEGKATVNQMLAAGYYAKNVLKNASHPARLAENQVQFITQLADKKGMGFAGGMISTLLHNGAIDRRRAEMLAKKLESYETYNNIEGVKNIQNSLVKQGAFILFDRYTQAKNSGNKAAADAALQEYNRFLSGRGAELIMLRMPDGDSQIYTYDQFNSLMDSKEFQEAASKKEKEHGGVFEVTPFAQSAEDLKNPKLQQILERFGVLQNSEVAEINADEEADAVQNVPNDEEILAAQKRTGFKMPQLYDAVPVEVAAVIDAVRSGDRGLTADEVNSASAYLFDLYKIYSNMSKSSTRTLTLDQIEAITTEFSSALNDLSEYNQNLSYAPDQVPQAAAPIQAPAVQQPQLSIEDQVQDDIKNGRYANATFDSEQEVPDALKPYLSKAVRFMQDGVQKIQITAPASLIEAPAAAVEQQPAVQEEPTAPAAEPAPVTEAAPAEEPAPVTEEAPQPAEEQKPAEPGKPRAKVNLITDEDAINSFSQEQRETLDQLDFLGQEGLARMMIDAQKQLLINKEIEQVERGEISEKVKEFYKKFGIGIETLSTEDFVRVLRENGAAAERSQEAVFDDVNGKIYINKDVFQTGLGTLVIWHDSVHPIMNIIHNSNKPLYDKIHRAIEAGIKANPEGGMAEAKKWVDRTYTDAAGYNDASRKDELIVEVIGMLASGRLSFNEIQPNLRQRLMDLINRIGRILGVSKAEVSDMGALKDLARKITTEINKAGKGDLSKIVGVENVGKFQRPGALSEKMAARLSKETQAKVKAGEAVGTRKPTAKKSPDLTYNKDLLIGLEATKANPALYKFNAMLVASYDIMYPVLPPTIKTYLNGIYKTLNKYQNEADTLRDEIDAAKKEIVDITAKQEKLKKTEAAKLTTRIIAGEVKRGGYGRLITDLRKKIDRLEQLTQKDGLLSKERERVRKEIEKYAKEKMTMQMAERIYKEFIGITQSNLEALVDLFPARLREVAKLWYDGANLIAQDFAKKYKTSIEQAAAVLAVFSPQKDWFMNISLAERLMNIYNNMMDYKFDDAMASKYLKRAGEPELTIDEKTGEEKWTGGAVPLLDEDGEHVEIDGVLQFKNWDNEKAKERIKKAAELLRDLKGKSLRELLDAKEYDAAARFVRMYSEVYDSPNFSFYTPDGRKGYESRSEKGTLRKIAWGGYNTIEKALRIMEATEKNKMDVIHDELGEMHKVRSFYNNIADPLSKEGHVTMDTHAIAAILWKALSGASYEVTQNFGGAGTKSEAAIGSNGLYPVFAEAYREAANNLGYLPREIQSITWEAVRMLFKAKWKGNKENVKKIGNIWAKFRNGELTIKQAREQIWSLATAGARGTIEEAIRNGEGVGSPDWAEILDSGLDPEKVKRADDAVRLSMAGGVRYDGERGDGRPGDVTGAAGVVPGPAEGGKPGGLELKTQPSLGGREKEGKFEPEKKDEESKLRSEQAGDRGGRSEGRAIAPLSGAPNVPGASGPDPGLVSVAEKYAKEKGIDLRRQAEYVELDEDRAVRLANAYEEMPHAPEDPKVKEAYADLIRQTKDQFNALSDAGYTFTFFDRDTDPYDAKPWRAMKDLRNNKTMAVYGTYDGYGTEGVTGAMIENNPMLEDTGLRWPDQKGVMHPVTANDLFRAVHDAFGHGLEGAGFRARGEENAWQAHVRLFTGPAVAAITSETRGQNSWLNYGPLGEKNRTADLENTDFALQKTGLMPEWTWTEGRAADMAPSGMQPSLGGRMSGTVLVDKEGNKLAKRGEQFTVEQLVSDINHPIYGPIFKHYAGKNKLIVLFGGRGDSEGLARWSLAAKDIKINVNHTKYVNMVGDQESLDYLVAHEIIHAIVDEYIRKDESAFDSFNKELSELKDILFEQDTEGLSPKLKEYLGYIKSGQPEELIAYSFTDPEVAAYFNSIKVSDRPGAKTIWNRIVDAVLKIVNQSISNKSLLNAVTETFNKYSQDFTAKQASLGGRQAAPTFAELDEILDMPPAKSRAAREKLIDQYGKETVDRMIEISRNFTKIINSLEEQGIVKKDCP